MQEKIKILIADDNKNFCNVLVEFFKQYNEIQVLGVVNTGLDEIKAITKLKPDIVITDIIRNDTDIGLKIIRHYEKKSCGPAFLVISATRNKEIFFSSRVYSYIEKPFDDYKKIINEIHIISAKIMQEQRDK